MARPLSFRWDEAFVARIDEARGLVPRSAFVRAAVERALNSGGSSDRTRRVADGDGPEQGVRAPRPGSTTRVEAPARSPDMRVMDLLREDDPDPDFVARGRVPEFPPSFRQNVRSSAEARRGVGPIPKGKP